MDANNPSYGSVKEEGIVLQHLEKVVTLMETKRNELENKIIES